MTDASTDKERNPALEYCTCPMCSKLVDAATHIDTDDGVTPSPGDYTICVYCKNALVFEGTKARLTLREATMDEAVELLTQLTERRGRLN